MIEDKFDALKPKIPLALLNPVKFLSYVSFSPPPHEWSILEVGGGKMPCRIIGLIGNGYFNDKKYSGPIILGDYVEKGSV